MQNPAVGGVVPLVQTLPPVYSQGANLGHHGHGQSSSLVDGASSSRLQEAHSTTTHQMTPSATSHNQMSALMEPSETDKRAIYKHPLFPLMALLFERCEQVTQTPDCPLVANLKSDIQSFVQHHQQRLVDFESCIGEHPEVDSLMIKAIQILWIHLLELDKVNELCKDFCTRYITCLRTKLQNEQLLHIDAFESDCGSGSLNDLMSSSMMHSESTYRNMASFDDTVQPMQRDIVDRRGQGHQSSYRMKDKLDEPPPSNAHRMQLPVSDFSPRLPGNVPQDEQVPMMPHPGAMLGSGGTHPVSPSMLASLANFDDAEYDPKTRSKRGILPKQATRVMKTWLFQHLVHPYPTEDEKRLIAEQTNLSILQVNNWFINARRRILQPIVDVGNQDGSKLKKGKNGESPSRPYSPQDKSSGSFNQARSMKYSESRSESSTPTSTTFDYDRNSLDEYSAKQHDGGHDDDDEDDDDDDDDKGQPTLQAPAGIIPPNHPISSTEYFNFPFESLGRPVDHRSSNLHFARMDSSIKDCLSEVPPRVNRGPFAPVDYPSDPGSVSDQSNNNEDD